MKLFAKGKGGPSVPSAPVAAFQPIDRTGLLGLLGQVVNTGQSGVLELQEPQGAWVYAFQAGALTHASGGRVRGARQAFDLLWEFQQGQFKYVPGTGHGLASNLYIDRARLTDLLRRSQAALQGPASPYIPAGQQRAIPQYPTPPPGAPALGWAPPGYPPGPAGYPQPPPVPAGYPQPPPAPGYPPAPVAYPQAAPPAAYPQSAPSTAGYPPPGIPVAPPGYPQPFPAQGYPGPVQSPPRQSSPQSFSDPPMPIPRKAPVNQAPPTPPSPAPPAAPTEAPKSAQVDDLKALRASLVAQAPAAGAGAPPAWKVRAAEGAPAPAAPAPPPKAAKGRRPAQAGPRKKRSRLRGAIDLQLIKFLLWACERTYSEDDHWTLKDAFEVSTMELRDQFVGAFSQSFKAGPKAGAGDEDVDEMAAGRMRGRAKSRKR